MNDPTTVIVPLLKLGAGPDSGNQSEEIVFFTEDKSQVDIVKWQARPADQPLQIFLLGKGTKIGVRKDYILFIAILFGPKRSEDGTASESSMPSSGSVT